MKRRLLVIASGLLLGAVINVAVAWTCAAVVDLGGGTAKELYVPLAESHHWWVVRWDRAGGSRIFSRCWSGLAGGPYNEGDPERLLARWGHIERPDPDAPEPLTQVVEAWGLPSRALWLRAETRPASTGTATTSTAHVFRVRRAGPQGEGGISLPLEPVWLGFAVNTVLYALAVLVVTAVARDARRALRRPPGQRAPPPGPA
ncbi:MAG: hypothetical protein ACYS0G_02790 [Planctomycetota bacterium]|jgi:hypothetical protein